MLELEQAQLREQFESLLTQQKQALAAYAELAAKLDDPAMRGHLAQLQRDKQRHIELTERLLEIVA